MKNQCCNNSYITNQILGIYPTEPPPHPCTKYCISVRHIEELPPIGNCPSGLAFVDDAPRAEYGGFIFMNDRWVSIFNLTNVLIPEGKVVAIYGKLLPEFELGFNGQWFNADEVLIGINCPQVFGYPLPLPLRLTYRVTENGCELDGQSINQVS